MKEKKLFDAITGVPDEMVDEAGKTSLKKEAHSAKRWAALAACIALIAGFLWLIPSGSGSAQALLKVEYPKARDFEDFDATRKIAEENPVEDSFITGINEFSYETGAQILSDGEGNQNYSPLSLYYALSVAAAGAKEETQQELLDLLKVSDMKLLSKQASNLYRRIYSDNKIGSLKIANSLWMDKNVGWERSFVENAAKDFYASVYSVDFKDENTPKDMEKWVSDNTKGTLSPEMDILPEQILSIINTVYFYDEWVDKFDKSATAEDTFYLSNGEMVKSDFMNSRYASAGFYKGEGFTRSSLSLKNSGSMVFILPDEGASVQGLLESPEKLKAAFEGGEQGYGQVVWQIPKFSFGVKYDLKESLKALGIENIFEENADFSGITKEMAFVSGIRQETHIAIDENGVEASAFTQIDYCGSAQPQGRADMILNRPFIFGITAPTGTLLFVGVCENPTQS